MLALAAEIDNIQIPKVLQYWPAGVPRKASIVSSHRNYVFNAHLRYRTLSAMVAQMLMPFWSIPMSVVEYQWVPMLNAPIVVRK